MSLTSLLQSKQAWLNSRPEFISGHGSGLDQFNQVRSLKHGAAPDNFVGSNSSERRPSRGAFDCFTVAYHL